MSDSKVTAKSLLSGSCPLMGYVNLMLDSHIIAAFRVIRHLHLNTIRKPEPEVYFLVRRGLCETVVKSVLSLQHLGIELDI